MAKKYDFAGWITKYNLRCSDGRVIKPSAFKECDGKTLPLVYDHVHDNIGSVLGNVLCHCMPEGIYGYGAFNETEPGQYAKECVRHGDIVGLSIYANHLKQAGSDVVHGEIKEVSLVLAGANPGAFITDIAHSDESNPEDFAAQIWTGDYIEHSDDIEDEIEKEKEIKKMAEPKASEAPEKEEKTVKEIFDSMTEDQKNLVYALVAQAMAGEDDNDNDDSDEEEKEVKHNVFAADETAMEDEVLSHADLEELETSSFADAKRFGSLRDSVLAHAEQEYGIKDINLLFPDARAITNTPEFLNRETAWVASVMNGTHHTPFARIKSVVADITADEARAKGYTKGKLKKEEVFSLLKRTTEPTTVYKKQKLDRDDIVDITDFDVLAWVKSECRLKLDEELARAFVYGDGRLSDAEDKIDETHIRPIVKDAELYTIHKTTGSSEPEEIAKTLVDDAVIAMNDYRGSGNPTAFVRQDVYTRLLLLKDAQGYRLYKSKSELALAMMAKDVIPVPNDVAGDAVLVMVNLDDYAVGADKGGAVSMFDDFDIDYNQQKYLIETRCSGALVKPYAAIAFKAGSGSTPVVGG